MSIPNSQGTNLNSINSSSNERGTNLGQWRRWSQNWNWKHPWKSEQWQIQDHRKVEANKIQWAPCWWHTMELQSNWSGTLHPRDSTRSSYLSPGAAAAISIHQPDTRPSPGIHRTTNTSHQLPQNAYLYFQAMSHSRTTQMVKKPNSKWKLEYHHVELSPSNALSDSGNITTAGLFFFKHPIITHQFFYLK